MKYQVKSQVDTNKPQVKSKCQILCIIFKHFCFCSFFTSLLHINPFLILMWFDHIYGSTWLMTRGAPAGGVSFLFWGLTQDICWADWSIAELGLHSIFSEPRSVNGEPNFIWPTVIEAAVIFRGRLAVAAAAKAFSAPHPHSNSLSVSL